MCKTNTSVYEKLQATRAKVAPVKLIYGSHFSATEATYKVSQNMGNLWNLQEHLQELHISQSQYKAYLYSSVYIFTVINSYSFSMSHIEYYHIALSDVSRIEFQWE